MCHEDYNIMINPIDALAHPLILLSSFQRFIPLMDAITRYDACEGSFE